MSNRQVWILVGVAAATLAFGYLATQRQVNATVTAGEATIQYQAGIGATAAPTPQEDSHAKMLRLIEESDQAIATYDAAQPDSAE
jgi:hypothetical protein